MRRGPQLLVGQVMHRRLRPVDNTFVYPVFFVQLPLRELTAARHGLFAVDRPGLLGFRSRDHGPRDGSPLLPWIEAILRRHGLPADGEIVLQTFPRVLGFVFNPVSFWYCHVRDGRLVAVLAEVNNTFGGTHSYLLHDDGAPLVDGQPLRARKTFHVSPFCTVTGGYRFRFRLEGATQVARIDYHDGEGPLLLTSISGRPQGFSLRAQFAMLLRMPLLTFGVVARIHWQALKLWIKKVPFHGAHVASSEDAQPQQEPTR